MKEELLNGQKRKPQKMLEMRTSGASLHTLCLPAKVLFGCGIPRTSGIRKPAPSYTDNHDSQETSRTCSPFSV